MQKIIWLTFSRDIHQEADLELILLSADLQDLLLFYWMFYTIIALWSGSMKVLRP